MDTTTNNATTGDYALVNGVNMYYETYGEGDPLILIHGGFGMIGMFAPVLPGLAESHKVIAVELQGHGHTAEIDRPFSFEAMADDIAALINTLGYEKVDVAGYSLGGGVALQTAIRHPELVGKLILISAPFRRDGWYPEVLAGMAAINGEEMAKTFMYQMYASVAPQPENFVNLANKTRELLATDYDWTEGVKALQSPMLIIIADADSVRPEHALEMFQLRGGGKADGFAMGRPASQFAIVPGAMHLDILNQSDIVLAAIAKFFAPPAPAFAFPG